MRVPRPLAGLALATSLLLGPPAAAQELAGTITRAGMVPFDLAVWEGGNVLFVSDWGTDRVLAFDGASLAYLGDVDIASTAPGGIAIDETRGRVYVHNGDTTAVIDAATRSVVGTIAVGGGLHLDEGLGRLYVLDGNDAYSVDVTTNVATPISLSHAGLVSGLQVNPVTHEVFVTYLQGTSLDIVDGPTLVRTTVAGQNGRCPVVNWIENKLYLTRADWGGYWIYDRDTGSSTVTSCVADSTTLFFNPVSNRVYTDAEVDGDTVVIEGATDACYELPMAQATDPLAVVEATNHVFYANDAFVGVLDDPTRVVALVPNAGENTEHPIDVHQSTARVFVANCDYSGAASQIHAIDDAAPLTRHPVFVGSIGDFTTNVMDPVTRAFTDEWYPTYANAMATLPGRPWTLETTDYNGLRVYHGVSGPSNMNFLGMYDEGSPGGFSDEPQGLALAPDGTTAFVANPAANTLGVVDLTVPPATGWPPPDVALTVAVGTQPWGVAVRPDGLEVYVANKGSDDVSVLDVASLSVAATIAVGDAPWGLATNPGGSRLYVANSGSSTVSVIDTATRSVVGTVPVGATPHWVAVSPDGAHVLVTNNAAGTVSVIDPATNTVTDTVAVASSPEAVAVSPDSTEAYVACPDASAASTLSIVALPGFGVTHVTLPTESKDSRTVAVPDTGTRFAGRILASGTPVAGATVRAWQGGEEKGSATSDAAGEYALFALRPGAYDLEASASGQTTVTWPGIAGLPGRTTVYHVDFDGGHPVPTIASLDPASAVAGGAAYTLTVHGSGFVSGALVRWNGSPRPTTFVAADEVRAAIRASDIATAGSAQVSVDNPSPGGGSSFPVALPIVTTAFELSVADAAPVVEGDAGSAPASFAVTLAPPRGTPVTVDWATADGTAVTIPGGGTFANVAGIAIPSSGSGTPYPSTVTVTGEGAVSKVTATLHGFGHTWPSDVDVLLVGPGGQTVLLMSDTDSSTDVTGLELTFDDDAAAYLPSSGTLTSGTWKPTNYDTTSDAFAAPAPAGPYGTALSVFAGAPAAGTWSLYARDDTGGDSGSISGGWTIQITASGGDYSAANGTLTFAPGETTKTAQVAVNGDLLSEPDETFTVSLSNPGGATLGDGQATGTIVDDDAPAGDVGTDFDGDGRADLFWRRDGSGDDAVWLMEAGAIRGGALLATVSPPWGVAEAADLDGDRRADVVWRDASSGENAVWFMNGAAVAGGALLPTVPPGWTIGGAADFDGDGKEDLLWNDGAGQAAVWLMDGGTVASGALLPVVGPTWSARPADFDGDGTADVFWFSAPDGATAVWLLDGTAVVAGAYVATAAGWQVAALADLDGDTKADVVWRDAAGATAVWLMDDSALASAALLPTVGSPWVLAGAGDFDGDGRADLLWRDGASGTNAIWFMDGATITSAALAPTLADVSWQVALP